MRTILVFQCLCLCAAALAQERVSLSTTRSLLVAALDSPDGRANGVLVGAEVDALTRRFHGASEVHVEVSTLRRYLQPGCGRLNLRIWQDAVRLPNAPTPRRQTIDVGINYCRDGYPPRSLD